MWLQARDLTIVTRGKGVNSRFLLGNLHDAHVLLNIINEHRELFRQSKQAQELPATENAELEGVRHSLLATPLYL